MTTFLLDDGLLAPHARLVPRIAVGVIQGLCLWALEQIKLNATAPMLFGAVVLCLCFVPTLVIGGFGQMRLRSLLIWAAIAAALLAALGAYDAWREALMTLGAKWVGPIARKRRAWRSRRFCG